mgnify:CR=1 FL=1
MRIEARDVGIIILWDEEGVPPIAFGVDSLITSPLWELIGSQEGDIFIYHMEN